MEEEVVPGGQADLFWFTRRANLEKGPRQMEGLRSRKRPLLGFVCGFRVPDDLPGRRGAAHVGGPAAGPRQEAKAAASE